MRYTNYKCDGCGEIFRDDDDVVVCPQCATPQHRECYKKNNCCVNSHLHSEDFEWKGEKTEVVRETTEEEAVQETANDLICPNCHYANPHGSTSCHKCGMKFTIFGINLAEKAQQEDDFIEPPVKPNSKPGMTPPDYPPPFTVGKGDNEEEEEKLPLSREEQVSNFLSHTISNASGYDAADSQEILFKGPFPDEMKVDGIPANTMGAFLAKDSGKYIEKFRRISNGNKLSFNWAAFFLSPYWFFYRKLYKPGIIFMTLQLCLSIIMTPSATSFLEFYESIAGVDGTALSEAAALQLTSQLNEVFLPMAVFMGIEVVLKLIAGFIANPLYRKYAIRELKAVEAETDRSKKLTRILKYGGISPLMPLMAYFAEQLLSYLSSYFF